MASSYEPADLFATYHASFAPERCLLSSRLLAT